jgi:hypothetical protein
MTAEIELKRALDALTAALPEGASIIVVPSVRARDRAEVVPGMLVPFGLASSVFTDPRYGASAVLNHADVRVFDGVVRAQHLDAPDVDESVIAMLAMSTKNGSPACALVPHLAAGGNPLAAFAALTIAKIAAVSDDGIELPEGGRPPRMFCTVHETIVSGPLPLLEASARVGILHVGGEDLAESRERARIARRLLTSALN